MTPSTRSLRQSVIARAEPAAPGAGFAATLERRAGKAEADQDSPARDAGKTSEDARGSDDRAAENADERATSIATEPTDESVGSIRAVEAGTDPVLSSSVSTSGVAASESPAASVAPDPTRAARELAATSVAEQAKTGPVTDQILTELALQGQAVGRFALVSPKFKPGAVAAASSEVAPGQSAPPETLGVGPSRDAHKPSPVLNGPHEPVVPVAAAERPTATTPTPVAAASTEPVSRGAPAKPESQPEALSRVGGRTIDAPSSQPSGQTRQDGSPRQDQPGRQSEAHVRGLDALLGRPAARARSSQPAADPSANRAISAQLERGVSAALNSRDGVVTLRLSPEQLGPLKVRVSVDKGAVKAAFEAASPQAKQAVEQSIPLLRDALASKGLTVERIEVTLAPSLPQRELGLTASPPAEQPSGLSNASVGDQSAPDHDRRGSSGEHAPSDRSAGPPEQIALDLSPIEQTGFRYITTPDGRLGVVALA